MEKEKVIVLNEDQKEVVLGRSKDAYFAIKQLNEWIQSDSLSEEMRETLPSLISHHLTDIKKAIGFTGEEPDRFKEMTKALNKAREDRISELEKMVESQNSILVVKQQLKSIGDKINKWWDDQGFNYIKEISFSENGNIKVILGFMLDSLSLRYSDTPASDKKSAKEKIHGFINQGYLFAKSESETDKELIDCDHNRELLTKLIAKSFPSAVVYRWENHRYMEKGPDKDKFYIRYAEAYIYDYSDIENL